MISRSKTTLIEWGFVMSLGVLCITLTILQFRWTGEIARGEAERLRGNLENRGQSLAQEFDAELTANCEALKAGSAEPSDQSSEASLLARFNAWKSAKPRPIFSRIGLAESGNNGIGLRLIDQAAATVSSADWPQAWSALKRALEQAARGGPPPSTFSSGMLLEFPLAVGGGPRSGPGGRERPAARDERSPESGPGGPPGGPGGPTSGRLGERWLILELDLVYLRDHWLPELAAKHLNPTPTQINEAEVRTTTQPQEILWSTSEDTPRPTSGVISVRFNRLGRTGSWASLPGSGSKGNWQIDTWPRPGALEALIEGSRRKNLAIATLISGLIAAAGLALLLYTRKARRLAEAQVSFVETVSHELRTPLTIICGAAHNMEKDRIDPASMRDYAAMIGRHGEQLHDMVEQVLDFAKSRREGLTLKLEPLITTDFLQATLASARLSPSISGCEISTHIPEDLPLIQCDEYALRRALLNLLNNAVRHGLDSNNAAAKPLITLTAGTQNLSGQRKLTISISDNGPGIPRDELGHIFEPFYRGSTARQNQIRGSGIGLSVVKEIIEAHGGRITAGNNIPCGASFTITIPTIAE